MLHRSGGYFAAFLLAFSTNLYAGEGVPSQRACANFSAAAEAMNEFGLWTSYCLPSLSRAGRLTTLVQCVPIHTLYCTKCTLLITGGPFYRPKTAPHRTSVFVALLLLFAGVEPNPGPSVKLGFVNAHSIVRRGPLICDMIASHDLDVLAVAETWIRDDDPCVMKRDLAPCGYDIVHVPHPSHATRSRGGCLCIFIASQSESSRSVLYSITHSNASC